MRVGKHPGDIIEQNEDLLLLPRVRLILDGKLMSQLAPPTGSATTSRSTPKLNNFLFATNYAKE